MYLSKLALTMDYDPARKGLDIADNPRPKLRRTSSRMAESEMAQLLGRGVSLKKAMMESGREDRDIFANTSVVEEQAYNAKKKANPALQLPQVKIYGETLFWGDYYNNLLKCWEPFVEPLSLIVIHEKVT